jgi:hypothetical protein
MSIEAMKMALEALTFRVSPDKELEAIAALRQAIEQAEKQEPVGWFDWDAKQEFWVQVYPNTHGQPLYALKERNT